MMNEVQLIGRLTDQPEGMQTKGGKDLCRFTLAVQRDYAPEGQERETDFIDCVAWGGTAKTILKNCTRGRLVGVVGRLAVDKYTAQDG